jgi:hypothetical protein
MLALEENKVRMRVLDEGVTKGASKGNRGDEETRIIC